MSSTERRAWARLTETCGRRAGARPVLAGLAVPVSLLGPALAGKPSPSKSPSDTPSPSPSAPVPELPMPTWQLPGWASDPTPILLAVAVLVALGLAVRFLFSGAAGRAAEDRGRLSLRARLWLRLHPGPGYAREWELAKVYGLRKPRRQAKRLRPSLSRTDRLFGDPRQFAIYLGVHRFAHRLWIGLESGVLIMGIPRSGKSSWLIGRIIDAPGAVVATSLRGDLVKHTIALRAAPLARAFRPLTPLPSLLAALVAAAVTGGMWQAVAVAAALAWIAERVISRRLARRSVLTGAGPRPVWVLDPQNVSGVGRLLPFSPVAGCQDAQIARSTAAYMVSAVQTSGVQNAAFWENSASQALRAMLHAAALGDYTLMDIYHWALTADETPMRVLRSDPRAVGGKVAEIQQFLELPEDTRKGVQKTLSNVLDFLADPRVAASVCSPEAGAFDVDHLVLGNGTLYMVADDQAHSVMGPLFAALAGRIMDRARVLAAASEIERLDPVLTVILDEVADTCPGPLESWARTSAGWGIVLMAAVHNPDQLVTKWGPSVANDIISSIGIKLALGGQTVQKHAELIAFMCGTRRVRESISDGKGGFTKGPGYREVPVMTASELMQLPDNYVAVSAPRAKSTIVRIERAFKRRDVKAAKRRPYIPPSPEVTALAEAPPTPAQEPDFDHGLSALLRGDIPAARPGEPGDPEQQPPAEHPVNPPPLGRQQPGGTSAQRGEAPPPLPDPPRRSPWLWDDQ